MVFNHWSQSLNRLLKTTHDIICGLSAHKMNPLVFKALSSGMEVKLLSLQAESPGGSVWISRRTGVFNWPRLWLSLS